MPVKSSRKSPFPRAGLAGKPIDPESELAVTFLANQQNSLLLKLPRELRDIIYSYVLGGKQTIFVDHFFAWRRTYVEGQVRELRSVDCGFHCVVWPPGTNPYTIKGLQVPELGSPGFTLMNSVCRQLYMETASIPMSENTWAFRSPSLMSRYLLKEQRMSLAQRRALKTIMLPSLNVLDHNLIHRLGNLKTIIVDGKEYETKYLVKRRSKSPSSLNSSNNATARKGRQITAQP